MGKSDMGMDRFKQIQEIILGEFAEAWEKQLQTLDGKLQKLAGTVEKNFTTFEQRLQELEQALTTRIDQTENSLSDKTQALRTDFETFRDTFRAETAAGLARKMDTTKISQLFADLSERLLDQKPEAAE